MPYKYIGKTTDFRGKTLWEIVGNLKNFGVGRIVTRSRMERYPEPSYMKILKVDALPNPKNPSLDDVRKVKVIVERTFRGKTIPHPVTIESASYKTDYRLIPKEEEARYIKQDIIKADVTILPKYTVFPPLMREIIIQEMIANGEKYVEPKLEIVYRNDKNNKYRIAEDGEKASFECAVGLGTPAAPSLYKGLKM